MEWIADHPDIRHAEKTGYPKTPRVAHQCSVCDEPIYEGDECLFIRDYGWICEDCAELARTVAER